MQVSAIASYTVRVIFGLEVVTMTSLLSQYINLLQERGLDTPGYRTEKLKKTNKKSSLVAQ